jgi:beta-lactamase class A
VKSKIIVLSLGVFLFLGGFIIGRYIYGKNTLPKKTERHEGQYQFINPLLECDLGDDYISTELKNFKTGIEDIVERLIGEGKAKVIAVYFRDLNNGPVFEINREKFFIPGSLLKIPILMGYLKAAEMDPSILDAKIKFEGLDIRGAQFFKPPEDLVPGKYYTIRDLLRRMIVYSDNYSAWLLVKHDISGFREKVYSDLGLPIPEKTQGTYTLNIKNDAAFFRVLFNASYLSKEMSNLALELLSNSQFEDGIVRSVPAGIPIAHKFGESFDGQSKQLHDCGIVYYPSYPYLLCVMTKGDDFNDLSLAISEVSRAAYENVDKQMRLFKSPSQ